MNGSTSGAADQVIELAVLLRAVALSADGKQGRQLWDGLAGVVSRHNDPGAVHGGSAVAELAALRREPGDLSRAETLARTLLDRASHDPAFGQDFGAWLGQEQVQITKHAVSRQARAALASTLASGPRAEPGAGAASKPDTAAKPAPKRRYRKAATYVGASILVPVLVIGLGALVSGEAQRLLGGTSSPTPSASLPPQGAPSPSDSPPVSSGSAIPGTAANSPARVEAVAPLNTEPEATRALAQKVQLSHSQLAQISKSFLSGNNQDYLPASLNPVPTESGTIDVTIAGNGKGVVTITGIQVIKHCQAPLHGTLFLSPSQGLQDTIGLDFDLDSSIDYARGKSGVEISPGNFFQRHVVTLKPGETHTFDLVVRTLQHYCQFTFQMSVVTPNGPVTETIDDNGKPFQLTSAETGKYSSYQALYIGGLEASLTGANKTGDWVQENPKTFRG